MFGDGRSTRDLRIAYAGDAPIKGPGLRLDCDVRRVWECPKCGRRLKLHAWIVTRRCPCEKLAAWMRLIEVPRNPRPAPQFFVATPIDFDVAEEEAVADEVSPAEVPAVEEETVASTPGAESVAEEASVEEVPIAEVAEPATVKPEPPPAEPTPLQPVATAEAPATAATGQPTTDTPGSKKKRRSRRNRSRKRRTGGDAHNKKIESPSPKTDVAAAPAEKPADDPSPPDPSPPDPLASWPDDD